MGLGLGQPRRDLEDSIPSNVTTDLRPEFNDKSDTQSRTQISIKWYTDVQKDTSIFLIIMITTGAVVPAAGLEPARPLSLRILSPLCLPFHHAGTGAT